MTCTRFLERDVLPAVDARVMLVMDEVDKVFAAPFRDDFFGMLRSWHNLRSNPDALWMNLELVLCGSTEPSHFISADSTQSPFNVGERIPMEDFTKSEVSDLVQRHGLVAAEVEEELYDLLHGHPFLTRRALYLLASKRVDFDKLRLTATSDDGPFGDHLRYYLTKLYEFKDLLGPFQQVLRNSTCSNPRLFDRLKGFGLVAGDEHKARPRNQLYASYFGQRLRS